MSKRLFNALLCQIPMANELGQCGDPGEDVSVIADRYFEKLGSIADQGPQACGLQ